ncbi:hypothetical protein F2Q69_00016248 [Brassica cretica]|uniref:RNase H type-1 domain-containing protein n=1 Tax=Brassica cretica TaxID=69181 RepID=A0A8S9QSJ1_BRACR|nr:hypothetical protein F2Q69_00016248 [Brassica cretica]
MLGSGKTGEELELSEERIKSLHEFLTRMDTAPRAGGEFGDKSGAPADYQPSFRAPGAGSRPGFGRGAGGDRGLPRLQCESDCAQLIQALASNHSFAKLYGIVADMKTVSLSFESISFDWISRKNKEADVMAKQCLADELVVMASPNNG